MSLILDALNRASQESRQVPGLDSHHPTDSALPDSDFGIDWLQWLLVAGLALAVLVIGWLLFDRMQPAAEVPAGSYSELSAAVTVSEMAAPAARQSDPARQQAPSQLQEKVNEASTEPVATETVRERPAGDIPKQESKPSDLDASVAALYQQQGQRDAAAQPATRAVPEPAYVPEANGAKEEAIDIEKLVAEAQAEVADTKLQDNGVSFLATLSQQTKDSIPTLMYLRHDYSGKSGKSRVLINGKTLSTGASVGGVKVVEILPDSVVLEFKGTRFRLRALNSWVNL